MNQRTELLPISIGILILLLWGGAMTWFSLRRAEPRRDLLAASLLAGMVLAFFWRTVSGDLYQPADGGDLVSFLFPTYRFAAGALSQGRLPLWNPHLYGGAPFIGDIQAGFLYPPNLALFLLRPSFDYRWMQWLSIGHLWWAGLGVYALARTLGHSRPAALLAGLAFGLSDALFIHLGNLNLIAVLSWSGWILAACHRALTRGSLLWAGVSAALFALANYAGHAQSSYYLGMAVGLYSVGVLALQYWASSAASHGAARRQLLYNLRYPGVLFILTALISAPILLPLLELFPFTSRATFVPQDTVSFSLAPTPALVGLLTPSFFGRGPALYWGAWDRVELPYAGLVTLLLAAGAFLLPNPQKRRRLLPWLALALFGMVVALGSYTPVHGWLTQLLPGYGSFRAPARTIVLWALAVSVLAAQGLDALLAGRARTEGTAYPTLSALFFSGIRIGALALLFLITPLTFASSLRWQEDAVALQRASMAGLAVLLATAVWLAVWLLMALYRRKHLAGGALATSLLILLLVELAAAGAYTDTGETDPTRGFVHPQVVAFLREQATAASSAVNTSSASHPARHHFRIDARTGIYDLWQPNSAALAGLADVWGIHNPLTLGHWEGLWENNGGRGTRIYDLLNVRFVLVRDGTLLPEQFTLAADVDGPLAIYENPDPLPRAWLVASAQIVPDEEAALAALQQPSFEPLRTVVLASAGERPLAAESPAASMGPPVSILSYNENEIVLAASAETAGYLVLSEVWYPGWRATVNGAAAPVLRANYTLRALPVPAGELSIRLWYAPDSWRWGLVLFGLGAALLLGLCLWQLLGAQKRQS